MIAVPYLFRPNRIGWVYGGGAGAVAGKDKTWEKGSD